MRTIEGREDGECDLFVATVVPMFSEIGQDEAFAIITQDLGSILSRFVLVEFIQNTGGIAAAMPVAIDGAQIIVTGDTAGQTQKFDVEFPEYGAPVAGVPIIQRSGLQEPGLLQQCACAGEE